MGIDIKSGRQFWTLLHLNLGGEKLTGEDYQAVVREVLPKGMYSIYEDVADYAQTIQQGINEREKLGIKAVKPKFNAEESAAIASKAAAVENYDAIPGGITNDMQHMAQNVATDTMKANAKLANDVGMEATVTRIYDGVGVHTQGTGKYKKECSWCLARCGTDVPYSKAIAMDMFRRHPGCGCKISYTVNGQTQVQTDWRRNQWEGAETHREASIAAINSRDIGEAQEYAKRFIEPQFMDKTFNGEADFKGISLEHANAINEALTDVYSAFPELEKLSGIKVISPTSKQGKKAFKDGEDALFAYDPIQHGVYINKAILKDVKTLEVYMARSKESWDFVMKNIGKLSGSQREMAERYAKAGRSLVDGDTVKGLFTHELGHHVQWTMLDAKVTNSLTARMKLYAPRLSGYAHKSGSEYLAESFTAYMKGERHLLDPEYIRIMDSKVKLKRSTVLRGRVEAVKKPVVFTNADHRNIIITSKQMGKKLGTHCKDYGLDPSKSEDRKRVVRHIADILQNYDEKVPGIFRGQGDFINGTTRRREGPVWFYIKGEDVVVVNGADEEFVTILKGGARRDGSGNKRVQGALHDYHARKRK